MEGVQKVILDLVDQARIVETVQCMQDIAGEANNLFCSLVVVPSLAFPPG